MTKAKSVKKVIEAPTEFLEILKAVTNDQMLELSAIVDVEFSDRMVFENLTKPSNMTIQTKLSTAKARYGSLGVAGLMIAANIDPACINRSLSEGKRFNVYAFDKLMDVLSCIGQRAVMTNAINYSILKSMIAFEDAETSFTGVAATAAASDKIKVPLALSKLLTRHTVAAATAPTQTSSTMNALMIAGVVKNTGLARMPVYKFTDAPVVARLRTVLA